MTETSSKLSRVDFDRLIARASTLHDERTELIDQEQARAIALDLGISASAWDAALRERASTVQLERAQSEVRQFRRRISIIALGGIVAGSIAGAMANQLSDGVIVVGAAAVAAGVGLVVNGLRRRSMRNTQIDIAAWWLSIPAGIAIGTGGSNGDSLVFAAASWLGCAALAFGIQRVRRGSASSGVTVDAVTA